MGTVDSGVGLCVILDSDSNITERNHASVMSKKNTTSEGMMKRVLNSIALILVSAFVSLPALSVEPRTLVIPGTGDSQGLLPVVSTPSR